MVAAGGSVWQVSLVVLWEGFPCLPPIDVRVWVCVVWHLLQRLQGQHLQVRGVLVVAKQERERDKRSVVIPHVATPPSSLYVLAGLLPSAPLPHSFLWGRLKNLQLGVKL